MLGGDKLPAALAARDQIVAARRRTGRRSFVLPCRLSRKMAQRVHGAFLPLAAATAEAEVRAGFGAGRCVVGLPCVPIVTECIYRHMLGGDKLPAALAVRDQIVAARRRTGRRSFVLPRRLSRKMAQGIQHGFLLRNLMPSVCIGEVFPTACTVPVGNIARIGTRRCLCLHSDQVMGMRPAADLGGVIAGLRGVLLIELELASVAGHGETEHTGNRHIGHKAAVIVLEVQCAVVQLKDPRAVFSAERRQGIERIGRRGGAGVLAGQIAAGAEAPNCHAVVGGFDCEDISFRYVAQRRPGARDAGGGKIDRGTVGKIVEAGSLSVGRHASHGIFLVSGNRRGDKDVFADPCIGQAVDQLVGHGRVNWLSPQIERIEGLDRRGQLEGCAGLVKARLFQRLRNRGGDPAEEGPAIDSRRGREEGDLVARRAGYRVVFTSKCGIVHCHRNRSLGHVLCKRLETVVAVGGGVRPHRFPCTLAIGRVGMRGMRDHHLIELVVGEGGIIERKRLVAAEFHNHGEALSGGQRHRLFQPDGLIAPVINVPGLRAGERACRGVVHGAVGIDAKGEVGIVAAHAEGDGLERFVAVGDEGLGNRVAAGQVLPACIVAGAVVLVVVVIVLDALHREEGDIGCAGGGVLIGNIEIAVISDIGSPGILDNPRAVMGRAVALIEVLSGKVVVPADHCHIMVCIIECRLCIRLIGLNPADGSVVHIKAAMVSSAACIRNANAHRACAVFKDVPLDLRDILAEEVLDRLNVGDIVLIGIVCAEAAIVGAAVHQRRFCFGSKPCPAHQRVTDQLARAALIKKVGVD